MLNHRLQYLLKKYYNKSATAEEREELMAALQDDSQDESIRSILLALMYSPQDQAYSLDEDKANRILKQIFEQDSGPESDEFTPRSEERRVGKECRSRGAPARGKREPQHGG